MGWDISLAWKKRCSTTLQLIFFQQLQSPTYPNLLARVVIFSWAFLAILGMSGNTSFISSFVVQLLRSWLKGPAFITTHTPERTVWQLPLEPDGFFWSGRKCQDAGHQTFNLQGFNPTSHNQSHHFLNILTNQQRDNPKAWIMVQTSPEQQGDKKVPALSE